MPKGGGRGRTSDYKPEYCEQVIDYGKQGKSRTWIAAELGVVRQTLYDWEKKHSDFLDALARAKVLEQQWWEDSGQDGMEKPGFGANIWGRSMAARFPDEWREKMAVTGGDGGPVEVADVSDRERAKGLLSVLKNAQSEPE